MNITFRNVLIFFAVLLLIAGAWYFRSIVVYILIAGVLSIMGRPLVDLICSLKIRGWSLPRSISALLTLLIIWGIILLFFAIFIPLVTKQINYLSTIDSGKIVQLIEEPLNKIENLSRRFNHDISNDVSLQEYFRNRVSDVLNINMVQNFLSSVFGILGNMLIAVFSISFITFFFLKDQHLFFESILMWVPEKYTENFTRALYSIKNLLTRYFIGIMIQSTCIMIMVDIGMTIAGIEFQQALVMGLIVGLLNVIPYVGPWLGFFIAVTMGLAANINQDFTTVVNPLLFYMTLVIAITQIVDNILFQPVIFSNSVKAHPLEIFIVVLAAGFAAGIPGMILGIPAYTVLRVFAREFFNNFKAVQKITSSLPPENLQEQVLIHTEKKPSARKPGQRYSGRWRNKKPGNKQKPATRNSEE
jgi:predicted PurR-regulated permease PerM